MSKYVYNANYIFADVLNNLLGLIPKSANSYTIYINFTSGGYTCDRLFFNTDENGEITDFGYSPPVGHVYSKEKGWDRQNRIFQTIQVASSQKITNDNFPLLLNSLLKFTDMVLPEYYFFPIDGILDNEYEYNMSFTSNGESFNKITVKISGGKVTQMYFWKGGEYVTVVHDIQGLTNATYRKFTITDFGNLYASQLNLSTFLQLFRCKYFTTIDPTMTGRFVDLGGLYGLEATFNNHFNLTPLYGYFPGTSGIAITPINISDNNWTLRFNETFFAQLKKNPQNLYYASLDYLLRFSSTKIPYYYYKLYSPENVKFNSITNILNWDSVKYADKYHLEYPNGTGYTITENQDFLYLNGKYILTAQSDYPFIATSDITEIMVTNYNTNIVFGYYNSSESNRLDKSLSQQFEAACTFRNTVSVLNPVIELEMDELPRINYVFLVALHRYYYVTDITIIRNRLYALHLAVDVLMSYKDEILNLNPIIERQEKYYNNLLVNDHVITQLKYNYSTQTAEGDISFSMTDLDFIITALTSTDTGNPPVTQQQVTLLSPMCGAYLITSKNAFLQFAEGILNPSFWDSVSAMFTNKGEYIYGIKGINFNIKSTTNLPWTGTSSISLGGKSVTGLDSSNVFIVPMGCTPYLEFRFDIPSVIDNNFAFMRTSPYTEYELFLPFVGWITLDADIIFSQNITYLYIIYYIDVVTLNATVVVSKISATGIQPPIKVRGENILYMTNCNVGVDIPWGTTNINEIYKTITTGAVSLAASAASGFVSYKAANSSANALYPASGRRINNDRQISAQRTRISGDANMAHSLIGGLSNTMNNTVLNLRQRFQHGNIGNGVSDTYVASKPVLRVKYPSILIPDNYSSLYGFPCGSTYKLSNLKGFTIVDRVHMDGFPNATIDEIEEIESILKSGVIL
jgi:hypothetical protein